MITYKVTVGLVRSFGIGLTIHSPKLNGLCIEIRIACFILHLWSRGKSLFKMRNYWRWER